MHMDFAKQTLQNLIVHLKLEGLDPQPYSGRGMYGRECVSVRIPQGEEPGDYNLPRGWRQDQLGLGLIVYWPSIDWE